MSSRLPLVLFLLSLLCELHSTTNVTRIIRSPEVLLRRQKRYLAFPTGSNLVLTMSFVKAVMQTQPKGWNVIGECDVPFPLPDDTRALVKQYKSHKRQRRELYSAFEESLGRVGLNGSACLNRFICDAQEYVLAAKHPNSLVRDLLSYLFTIPEDSGDYCSKKDDSEPCEVSLFYYVISSLIGN